MRAKLSAHHRGNMLRVQDSRKKDVRCDWISFVVFGVPRCRPTLEAYVDIAGRLSLVKIKGG